MSMLFLVLGIVLGLAGLVSLFSGAWLAAIAFGMFGYGSLGLAQALE